MKRFMSFPYLLAVVMACVGTNKAAAGDSTYKIDKTRLLQLINEARKKGCNCGEVYYGPAPALAWNEILEKAAFDHSTDMSSKKYFSHDSPSGTTPDQRIKNAGYKWTAYGENIGLGYLDEAAMVKAWLGSTGHCRNIMNRNYKEVGVAKVNGYWTADFGAR
jgi:uncharacterized protein YkwD